MGGPSNSGGNTGSDDLMKDFSKQKEIKIKKIEKKQRECKEKIEVMATIKNLLSNQK